MTLVELVTIMAIVAVFAGVAVPTATHVGRVVAGAEAARRLALVLRTAQAEAQARGVSVRVEVAGDGDYCVSVAGQPLMRGELRATITSTYPDGVLVFSKYGWACLPGASSPRAGHFAIASVCGTRIVTVQLSGCIRCT